MKRAFADEPYLEQALTEHRDLHRFLDEIRLLFDVSAEDATPDRLTFGREALCELQSRLQAHFAQEEEGGYLDEAVSRLPAISRQAAILQRQHGEFAALADRLVTLCGQSATSKQNWPQFKEALKDFTKKLEAHERAEDALLTRAFNVDPDP